MKGMSKYLFSDMKDAVKETLAAETAHLQTYSEKIAKINELQAKIDKLRRGDNRAWWNLPPEERMRKALESIALMAVYNEHLANDHILQICRKALTGVNTEKHGDVK